MSRFRVTGSEIARGRRSRRWMLAVAAVTAFVVAVPLVTGGLASAGGTRITVYSGQHPQSVASLVSAFEKQTGIQVSVRSDDEGVLAAQIVQEGSHSPADVVLTENSPPLEDLQQRGLLALVAASTLERTSGKYDSPQRRWVGVTARVSVLVYNTGELSAAKLPKSVLALADPRWKGKLAIAPTETDFQPIVTAVAARYGAARTVAWLEGLKRNAADHIYPDNESLVTEVNAGRAELGVINHYYWYRMRDELGPAKVHSAEYFFAAGDPGYVVDVAGAGILASSSHQAADQRFLAFLVGKQGQKILAHDESYEYPLGSGVVSAKPLAPFKGLRPDPISIAKLGNGQAAVGLLRQAGLL
jgi:iron(III) transport system substrate-binding protein